MYFNTGAWATLMRLTKAQLADAETFRPVFDRLRNKHSIDDIEDLVDYRPTAVTIVNSNGTAKAELQQVYAHGAVVELGTLDRKEVHANDPA